MEKMTQFCAWTFSHCDRKLYYIHLYLNSVFSLNCVLLTSIVYMGSHVSWNNHRGSWDFRVGLLQCSAHHRIEFIVLLYLLENVTSTLCKSHRVLAFVPVAGWGHSREFFLLAITISTEEPDSWSITSCLHKTEEEMVSFVFQFVRDDGLQCSGLEAGLPLPLQGNGEKCWRRPTLRVTPEPAEPLCRQNWIHTSLVEITPSNTEQKARWYFYLTLLLLDFIYY